MLGMLVAIPIVALLKDILDSFIEYREEQKLIAVQVPEEEAASDEASWL